ncbi:PspC domain-containing protein [Serinibacter arcticus]|uniref:Phage shock protein C, PspC n=1 Tax=Serinibacter arcticus TaxID=1655435 RepID=A0A4Z1E5W4_9MICO|nr:PspC domain-containing protein [Serinibacter arcticus]TGO06258.1 phage shock protein C, PspC [Serinibacter arcticus]
MSTPLEPPPSTPAGGSTPPTTQPFWTWVRDLGIRRSQERWIGGVAGGVAARWGLDPLVVRGLFAASLLLGGVGFLAYGVAWALLPEPDGRIHAERALRGHGDSALVGIGLFVVAGIGPASWFGAGWAGDGAWNGLRGTGWIVVALLVYLYVRHRRTGKGAHRNGGQNGAGGAGPTPQPSGAAPLWGSAAPSAATSPAPTVQDLQDPYGSPAAAVSTTPFETVVLPDASASSSSAAAGASSPSGSAPWAASYAAPRPPAPLVRGPGGAMVAVVAALAILTVAGLLLANRAGVVAGSGWALTVGVLVTLVGVATVVTGLRGRRSGILMLFAIVGLVAAPSALTNAQGWNWDWEGQQVFGEVDITPTTRDEAAAAVSIGAGSARIDLTQVPLTDETLTVPISINAGEIVVVVPQGADVRADLDMFAGEVSWTVDGQDEHVSGRLPDELVYSTDSVADGAQPQLVLDLQVGAGDVQITEATS